MTVAGIVNWAVLGPEFTVIDGSATVAVTGLGGLNLTVSDAGGLFERRDQADAALGFESPCFGWFGNFSACQNLLWTGEPTGFTANGPITLTFSSPVQGVGTQIQNTFLGDFRAMIAAFDSSGQPLGEFFVDGLSTDAGDGSAPFIGVLSTELNIRSVVLSTSVPILIGDAIEFQPDNDFAINDVLVATPEPAAFLLFGTALAALIWLRLRRAAAPAYGQSSVNENPKRTPQK